jgi:tetratricopeptide (TPR) repeat protein
MRRVLIGLALVLAAIPASAQTSAKNIANCGNKNADISIAACTAMLQAKPAMSMEYRQGAYFTRGNAYDGKGLEDLAIADFTSAMALKPDPETLANLYLARGFASYHKSLFAQSIADFSKMIVLKPDYADVYKLRGGAYELSGQLDKAIADYRTALKLEPDAKAVKDALSRLGVAP